jgi:hypothetical protein
VGISIFAVLGFIAAAMTVFDEPKSSIFQALVFFACLLLISAVGTLSKRIDRSSKAEDEISARRAENTQSTMRRSTISQNPADRRSKLFEA